MRQRKVKNEEQRLAALDRFAVKDGASAKGQWRTLFFPEGETPPHPLYLEIGCGRGHFLASHALNNPDCAYVGAEGRSSIVLRAMERCEEQEIGNVRFFPDYILRMEDLFESGELSGIYVNFCDPWPKKRHAKRRLTYRTYLNGYSRCLAQGGSIEFKTDNADLFNFTLEEVAFTDLTVVESTRDLHRSDLSARLTTTQYEHRFQLLDCPIHYCKLVKREESK